MWYWGLGVQGLQCGSLGPGFRTEALLGFPKIRGTVMGSHNKEYSILGSISGSQYFGKHLIRPSSVGFRQSLVVCFYKARTLLETTRA